MLQIGIRSLRRKQFWRLLATAAGRSYQALRRAVVLAVQGVHLIRYTEEHVLPRLEQALATMVHETPEVLPRSVRRPTQLVPLEALTARRQLEAREQTSLGA